MNQKTDDPTESNDEPAGHPPDDDPDAEPAERSEVAREVEETDLANIVREPEEPEQRESPAEAVEPHGEAESDAEPGHAGTGAPPARRGLTAAVAWLGFLLALAALAGVAWLGWQGRDSGARSADNARAIDTLADGLDETTGELSELQERLGELGEDGAEYADELATLGRRVDELAQQGESVVPRLARLEDAIASLQGISAGVRETWMLAEAEYYLQVANAQLQLANNPEVALLALNYADERIRQLSNPGLTDVRRTLSREIQTLEAHERADVEGVTLTLANLAERVDSLPLDEQIAEPPDEAERRDPGATGLSRAYESVKQAFGDLVSVRRTDEAVRPLMSPDATHFLRANLALQFQTARLAFLRGEQAVFRRSLADAAAWLERYYDPDSTAVQRALQTIAETRESRLAATPPDISESLRLLRRYRSQRDMETAERAGDEPAQ